VDGSRHAAWRVPVSDRVTLRRRRRRRRRRR